MALGANDALSPSFCKRFLCIAGGPGAAGTGVCICAREGRRWPYRATRDHARGCQQNRFRHRSARDQYAARSKGMPYTLPCLCRSTTTYVSAFFGALCVLTFKSRNQTSCLREIDQVVLPDEHPVPRACCRGEVFQFDAASVACAFP